MSYVNGSWGLALRDDGRLQRRGPRVCYHEIRGEEMKRCKGQGKDSAANVSGKNSREYYIKICSHFYDVLGAILRSFCCVMRHNPCHPALRLVS